MKKVMDKGIEYVQTEYERLERILGMFPWMQDARAHTGTHTHIQEPHPL